MALPKQIKKYLPLTPEKQLLERREQLLEFIQKDGTYLPKGILHADLDRGMLDFVRDELECVVDGKKVSNIDLIITLQNWAQFTQTWNTEDLNGNVQLPFITTVRQPEVPFGTNPSLQYTIPNRKEFLYAQVPTWDGTRKGMDVYKIPQPIPVDITYDVKIVCNRMRELNQFNKIVMQKFSSRQAYTFIKGHYIPIIMNSVSDNSVTEVNKRKFYVQNYNFTMLGFLMDEEEFQISPAITRALTLLEVNNKTGSRKATKVPGRPDNFDLDIKFTSSQTQKVETFRYTVDLLVTGTENIDSYDVYIDGNYLGSDLSTIQITDGDLVTIDITKITDGQESVLQTTAYLK
jgi:hypothetical protein